MSNSRVLGTGCPPHFGRRDVVLNSVGYALVGAIEEAKLEDVKAEFATTFFGRHRAGAVGRHRPARHPGRDIRRNASPQRTGRDPRLAALFPAIAVTRFDAAQIDDHLAPGAVPSVVMMKSAVLSRGKRLQPRGQRRQPPRRFGAGPAG